MQDSPAAADYWQLFKSVQPLFASDIPWQIQHDSQHTPSREISPGIVGDLIKACIMEASVHVQKEPLDLMTASNFPLLILEDLREFLYELDLVIRDVVFDYIDRAAVNDVDERVRKLGALGQLLRKSESEAADVNAYTELLSLNQTSEGLHRILVGIVKLNKRLVVATSNSRPNVLISLADKTGGKPSSVDHMSWLQTSSNPSFWDSSQKLWEALMAELKSCKAAAHSTMLSLKGLNPLKPDEERADFNMLFQSCSMKEGWQAVLCSVLYKNSTKCEVDDTLNPGNICQAVETANDYKDLLHIRVHEERCWCQPGYEQQPAYPEALPTMTMSQLLDSGVLGDTWKFDPLDKWILALNLAESLLQFHGGPWLQNLWTSENLFLLYEADHRRKLRNIRNPFVKCTLSDNPPSLPSPVLYDNYPLLLTFGQFLLELAGGKRLPVQQTRQGQTSLYLTLKNNFIKFHMVSTSEHYKKAIEGCLDFHKLFKEEKGTEADARVRKVIFKNIVQPLEQHLRAYIEYMKSGKLNASKTKGQEFSFDKSSPKDLDLGESLRPSFPQPNTPEFVAASKPPESQPNGAVASSIVTHVSQVEPDRDPTKTASEEPRAHGITPQYKTMVSPCPESDGKDSSSESESESESGSAKVEGNLLGSFDTKRSDTESLESLEWGQTFQKLSETYHRCFQHRLSDKPVKVAILDTGIDLAHPEFRNRRSRLRKGELKAVKNKNEEYQYKRVVAKQNFCKDLNDTEDVTDFDGHGTHIAGIILQLAPTAQLYVARVCRGDDGGVQHSCAAEVDSPIPKLKRSADLIGVDPENVEKAIRWAIEQKVDLINMSFGFRDSITAIDKALGDAKADGIVVFAASANLGNHTEVAWPARDRERAICVHSSNDYGTKKSEFMPQPHERTTNFMVMGEMVCSHRPELRGGGFQRLSGASMATPVATAIAALILAFVRQSVVCEETKNDVEKKIGQVDVKDNEGLPRMRGLLRHISNEDPNVKYCHWLQPELLWRGFDVAEAQAKDPSAASRHAWQKIREALRK